jgi:hypothetical protein
MNALTKYKPLMTVSAPAARKFYEDQYATLSFEDAIPCVKLKLSGVPQSSEHYQHIHHKLLESVQTGLENYVRLHLLTDSSKAGLVLDEDILYYQTTIIPALEKAGIRYHAIILPDSRLVRYITYQSMLSTKKLKVATFETLRGAHAWLKHQ